MSKKIRIAVVGCGRIAENHFSAIQELNSDLELVGACDNNPKALDLIATNKKIPIYQKIEDLIAQTNPDIITLCTPSGLHAQQTIQIAAQKKHVITEKPMATRWQDALAMIHACKQSNVQLFVVKQNRYLGTLKLLKQAIEKKRFGKIYLVNINVYWTRPQTYYDEASWRGTKELDGGAFMNQASHYVDLLNWLMGPVQNVHAMMSTLGRQIEVEDTGVLNINWQAGTVGSMNVTMLTYPKNLEGSVTIIGEKGTVKIGGTSVNEIQHWDFADKQPEDETIPELNLSALSKKGLGHVPYYENVIKTLRGESKPDIDGEEGLKSLEILTAAYLSARENRTVSLPLERI